MPVFKIRLQEGEVKVKIVHHDMLLPLKQDWEVITRVSEMEPEPPHGTVKEETNDSDNDSDE